MVIKPSDVDYDTMAPEQMAATDLDGNVMEGTLAAYFANENHVMHRLREL